MLRRRRPAGSAGLRRSASPPASCCSNLLGLIILVTGILYFNQFRQGLIDARVQSLTTQAQIIAAAVAGSATVDTGSIVIDPDSLADSNEEALPDDDQLSSLDFPIDPETAGPVLKRLLATTTVRARIIDKDGNLIVDSRFLYSRGDIVQSDLPPLDADERRLQPDRPVEPAGHLDLQLRLPASRSNTASTTARTFPRWPPR